MQMRKIGTVLLAVLAAASAAEAQPPASLTAKTSAAGTTRGSAKATIVLVRGAFALERFYAKRIKARTTEIASSHVVSSRIREKSRR
jgi:hypothetical protein